MKTLILTATIALLGLKSYASNNEIKQKEENAKLSYEEFIETYGTDDTSKAIINIFFDKRENSGAGQMSFLPVSGVVTIVAPPIGVGLMALSTPLFVNGLIVKHKYSRKKLLKVLQDYHSTHTLSEKYEKRVVDFIEVMNEIESEEIAQQNMDRLKSIQSSTNYKLVLK